ncbi:MAG: TonB C-terminal domain-containing protein [Burkholderiales bacterium]|nr:TonB C-terminal domain-containing protein [Burkholderiales bacterium]
MTADPFTTAHERAASGALAVVTHLLFLALIVFGVTWQKRQPEAMVVDLWNNLPPLAVPRAEPAPEPTPKPEPRAVKPEPRAEPKPVPKAEPKAVPKPVAKAEPKPAVKPDIALREKKEQERKAAEAALAEKKRREQEQAQAQAAMQAKEAAEARQRAAREEEAQKKLAAQQATAQAKLVDEYKRRIAERIKRFIVEPPNLQGNPEVEFDVVLLPGGEVLGVKTRRASGTAWDNAVERAILKAQPLPLPPDPTLFREFRELNLKFRPKE